MTNHPFLTAAETRAAHLRKLSLHLRALEVDSADLADVEREIPELEAAMAVYRRLHSTGPPVANGPIPKNGEKPAAHSPSPAPRKTASSTRRTPARRRADTPSFKDFARTHLDKVGENGAPRAAGETNGNAKGRAASATAATAPSQSPRSAS